MADKKPHAVKPPSASNPNVQSSGGAINPSAPSTGTAGWGTTPDEQRKQVVRSNPEASSPNAEGAGDIRHTSYPQNEAAQNPAARKGVNENAADQNANRPHSGRSLRCSDAMTDGCAWSVTGDNEDELLGYMRSHARAAHGKSEFTSEELENVRRSILKRVA
jgi:predicted small metal-binding protein